MIRRLPGLVGALLVLSVSPVAAQNLYVGAGIGNTFLNSEIEDAIDEIREIDENATAWKIFGGFSPSRFLGVEGGYRSFGEASTTIDSTELASKTTGWDVEALGKISIAIVDVFGKAGAMFWKQEVRVGNQTDDASGTDFFWGLGAGVHLGPIGVRAEWETVELGSSDNLSMASLSATLGF